MMVVLPQLLVIEAHQQADGIAERIFDVGFNC